MSAGRVSHTVIPRSDAGVTPHCDAGQNTQLLAGFRVGARNDSMRDTPC